MIKVIAHGNRTQIVNPVNGSVTNAVNVQFAEEGRAGGNLGMSQSSDLLSKFAGSQTGLEQIRVHTHPVLESEIGKFPVGTEIPGHINRSMFSTPQIRQQQNVPARMIDGKPTFFTTYLGEVAEDDKDFRIDQNVLAQVNPSAIFGAQVGATQVRIIESRPTSRNSQSSVVNAGGQPLPQNAGTGALENA